MDLPEMQQLTANLRQAGLAAGRLAQDDAIFRAALESFRAEDAERFQSLLGQLGIGIDCERVCSWFCSKECVVECIELTFVFGELAGRGGVLLNGNCPLTGAVTGNPPEYRFVIGEWTWAAPAPPDDPSTMPSVPPAALSPVTQIEPTLVGHVYYHDPLLQVNQPIGVRGAGFVAVGPLAHLARDPPIHDGALAPRHTTSRGLASPLLVHAPTAALTPVLGANPRSGAPGHQLARRKSVDPG